MKKWQFRENLILSVIIHVMLVLVSIQLPKWIPPHRNEVVEITYTKPTPPPVVEKVKKFPEVTKQIVEQDEKKINDEKPSETKLLSAHNQVVQKQTIAKNLGEFKNAKDRNQNPGDGGSPEQIKKIDIKPLLDFRKIAEKKLKEERELEKALEEEAIKVQMQKDAAVETASTKHGKAGGNVSATTDYLKDVDKGLETLLSTREFMYYSFYARIRRQLNQHWSGKVREKMQKIFKEGRSIASSDDKITKLMITLNKGGELVRVQVLNDSGVRDLDEAAIEAFREAAPFPNPPEGIAEPDGTIKIRWDFILEASMVLNALRSFA